MAVDSVSRGAGWSQETVPDPEVPARARRRSFSARYKLEVLALAEACREPGELGALLRRQGLYSSHLTKWRQQRDQGQLQAVGPKRGRRPLRSASEREIERLVKDNERLQRRLGQAELIIEVQKKLSRLLGRPLSADPRDGSS